MSYLNRLNPFIEEVLAPFLLTAFTRFQKKRSFPLEPKKIGVFNRNGLSDCVLLSAIFQDLENSFPNSEIIFFTTNRSQSLKNHLPGIDKLVSLNEKNIWQMIKVLRSHEIDIFIDTHYIEKTSALISYLSQAKYTVGFNTDGLKRGQLYDQSIDHSLLIHDIDNYRNLARSIGAQCEQEPHLFCSGSLPEFLRHSKYLVFHFWSTGEKAYFKEWGTDKWHQLASYGRKYGFKIVLTGSPADKQKNQNFVDQTRGQVIYNLAGCSMDMTLSVLKNSQAVISVNSAIMHMASTLSVPTFALNGPTDPARFGAHGPFAINITPRGEGHGYLKLGNEFKNNRIDCMEQIQPKSILKYLARIISPQIEEIKENSLDL